MRISRVGVCARGRPRTALRPTTANRSKFPPARASPRPLAHPRVGQVLHGGDAGEVEGVGSGRQQRRHAEGEGADSHRAHRPHNRQRLRVCFGGNRCTFDVRCPCKPLSAPLTLGCCSCECLAIPFRPARPPWLTAPQLSCCRAVRIIRSGKPPCLGWIPHPFPARSPFEVWWFSYGDGFAQRMRHRARLAMDPFRFV